GRWAVEDLGVGLDACRGRSLERVLNDPARTRHLRVQLLLVVRLAEQRARDDAREDEGHSRAEPVRELERALDGDARVGRAVRSDDDPLHETHFLSLLTASASS